jgi:transcription factor IIIB subunit 2
LEENTIIAEISFNESGGGAASVVGTFVGEGKGKMQQCISFLIDR